LTTTAETGSLPGLAELTAALCGAARAGRVLCVVDPQRRGNASVFRGDCDRTPRITIDADLVDGDGRVLAGVVAHEVAHLALGHHTERATRLLTRFAVGAGACALVAASVGAAAAAFGGCAAMVALWLAVKHVCRSHEHAADVHGAWLLDQVGQPGRECVLEMVGECARHESATYRYGGWLLCDHPPSRRRRSVVSRRMRNRR
jgi:Zn-dependent protease with chaperone function